MTYTMGDTVVHPQHGMATVGAMVSKDVGAGPADYLELYIDAGSLKVMVPAAAVEAVGIRDISTKQEAEHILAILQEPSDVPATWSERNNASLARVRSHDLGQVSMVVRDLSRHQERSVKPLAMGERALLKSCLDIVSRELALALDMSEEDTKALIVDKSLATASSTS